MTAKIHVITGPMGSGKTQTLANTLYNLATIVNRKVLFINHSADDREAIVSSHDSSGHSAKEKLIECDLIDKLSVSELTPLKGKVEGYNVIGIDEAQFFKDLEVVESWRERGIDIYIAGLYRDKHNNSFGKMIWAILNCDELKMIDAICVECVKYGRGMVAAPFTAGAIPNMSDIVIAGMDKYIPVCREHYSIYNNIEKRVKGGV